MNRLAGLGVLAVALAAAVTLAAQDAGSAEQTPATTDKPVAPATGQTATEQTDQENAAAEKSATDKTTAAAKTLGTKLPGDTRVRIVRLSQAHGKVAMDRGAGRGLEQAMQNMPIVEGMLLGTANEESYAEVEFEDASTMRLGPGTVVKFSQLVTRATGAKATVVRVDRGTVYVSRENTKADEWTLVANGVRKMDVQPGTHMRLELDGTRADVAVFSGNVSVDSTGGPVMVGKKQTLSVDIADTHSAGELAKKVEEGPYDGWDKDAQKYHDKYAKGSSLLGGNGYGVSDLNYYGSFMTVDGCGTFWQPYFVTSSWSPYGTGLWAQYATGYSWVSPYPWGWLPYHSGGWCYCPSRGWGWQPGGAFVGLNNVAGVTLRNGPAHLPGGGLPRPPVDAKASMVVVNRQPLVMSRPEAGDRFVFQKDSAGLGVPRGSLGKLGGISNDVARHGFANRDAYTAPAGSPSRWNDGQVYHGPLALHRGEMPDDARQAMWARQQAAAANGLQGEHRGGQFAAGQGEHHGPQMSAPSGAAGWQGRQQGQAGQLNSGGNNLGWKGQGGANAAAGANGSHSWNHGGAGAGAGAGAGGASAGGHTWNGGGNAGASASGGHTWNSGGGQGGNAGGGSLNAGGGGRWSGGGGGSSAGAGGGGHSGGGGNGGGGGSSGSSGANGGSHK